MRDLTPKQSAMLEDIDFTGRVGINMAAVRVVLGMTKEKIQVLVEMEMLLLKEDLLRNNMKIG